LGAVNGRRIRKQFAAKDEAVTFAQQARAARESEGAAAFVVPLEVRAEAARCTELLTPHGVTLTEAVRYYLEHFVDLRSAPRDAEIFTRLLEDVKSAGRWERTVRGLRNFLDRFSHEFGDRLLADITLEELQRHCCPPKLAPRSRFNQLRMATQLYNYAITNGWADDNLAKRIVRPTREQKEPGMLTVDQVQRLLQHADEFGLLPYMALGLFAGIRTAELMRLDWTAIKFEERMIVIGADVAKTRSRRVIPVNDTLAAWLALSVRPRGAIVDRKTFPKRFPQLKRAAGIDRWPPNALRHSYASYHLAAFENPAQTVHYMGHVGGTEMLHSHYKGLVSRTEAEKFWALGPALLSG
jgi:integrase